MQLQDTVSFTRPGVIRGIQKSLPMAVGVVPFGLVFGVMARLSF
jgi:predicted branched-subunit amino acid permease